MLSIAQCKEYLKGGGKENLNDKQIEQIRNFLYTLTKRIIAKEISKNDFIDH